MGTEPTDCAHCGGTGWVYRGTDREAECWFCDGAGRVPIDRPAAAPEAPLEGDPLAELRALAVAADYDDPEDGRFLPLNLEDVAQDERGVVHLYGPDGDGFAELHHAPFGCHALLETGRFFAACDPHLIVALIDEVLALRAGQRGTDRLREAVTALADEWASSAADLRTPADAGRAFDRCVTQLRAALAVADSPQEPSNG